MIEHRIAFFLPNWLGARFGFGIGLHRLIPRYVHTSAFEFSQYRAQCAIVTSVFSNLTIHFPLILGTSAPQHRFRSAAPCSIFHLRYVKGSPCYSIRVNVVGALQKTPPLHSTLASESSDLSLSLKLRPDVSVAFLSSNACRIIKWLVSNHLGLVLLFCMVASKSSGES